jgi:hypothetical protein
MPATTNEYLVNNFMAFAIVGIIIKLFFQSNITTDGTSGPANSSIWGYGVVSLSIFSIMFLSFALASNMANLERNLFDFIKVLFSDSLPSIVTLLIIVWLIVINVTYFKRINQGKLSDDYIQFSTITTILIIIQLIILFTFLRDQTSATPSGSKTMAYVVYALTFINVIYIGMMNIILKFFSTDG